MGWNTLNTEGPLSMTASIQVFTNVDGFPRHAYVARPVGRVGSRPGIVLVHHMPGWDEFYFETAERLARHGYDVICPDLYCQFGHGTPDDVAAKARASGHVHDSSVVDVCGAARRWLVSLERNNGRVGILGSCSGGRHAVLAASLIPGFDATVDLWGGGVVAPTGDATAARPVAPIEYTESLASPLLGIFGNEDQSPSPEQVDVHEARLRAASKTYQFHRYEGAGHGFAYYHTARYRPEQAMDAWAQVFDFLDLHLEHSGDHGVHDDR